jgi:alpha-N-arabinofuranosidase
MVLPAGETVPLALPAPKSAAPAAAEGVVRLSVFEVPVAGSPLAAAPAAPAAFPLSGNFTLRDEFDAPVLAPAWTFLRTPREEWWSLSTKPGALSLTPRAVTLREKGNPAFVARRQQHTRFTATTALRVPADEGVSAGVVAFQNETHHFFFGVRRRGLRREVFLERVVGQEQGGATQVVATAEVRLAESFELRIVADGARYTFSYATHPGDWRDLKAGEDGTILSTHAAGGFVGTMLGVHARVDAAK